MGYMEKVVKKAYAKINLGLDVTGVLPNGYHEVKMIMQRVGICDELTFLKREDDQIVITTNNKTLPLDEGNLIYKAILLIRQLTGNAFGVDVHLEKHIPIAAGMAGGSSDAAATLVGVNELFELGLSQETLIAESVKIGADVPYCVMGGTALSEGIGEKLTKIATPPQAVLLVAKPDINVSTPVVYKKLDALSGYAHPDIDGMQKSIEEGNLQGVIERLGNVLELVTIADYPIIAQIKEQMNAHGALGSLMSGSGPSVFGIFETKENAQKAYDALQVMGISQLFITSFVDA